MNNKELLKELEKRMARYGYCDTQTHIGLFIKEYESLTKDEKSIRLKDVIKRIKGFDNGTKFKWTYDILKELGSDFASKIFHEGYQQGRFDEAVETHHEPEKVKVPQFVADWYEEHKDNLEYNIWDWMKYNLEPKKQENVIFSKWLGKTVNKPVETLIKMKLYGYEVEKEKRYTVVMKGTKQPLFYNNLHERLFFSLGELATRFTRKQIEDAGLGEVFNSPLFEVEEVE